jgi:cytochrome P450
MISAILKEADKMEPAFTSEELFYSVFTTLAMGHENVSSAMSWSIAMAAQNLPDQLKILAEFESCENNEQFAERLMKAPLIPHTIAVFKETIRLYPAIPMLSRMSCEEIKDLKGLSLPHPKEGKKPVEFIISPWTIHRCKEVWGEDAASFRPLRWLDESFQPWTRDGAYFPFGIGARACLGSLFAKIETAAVLGMAVRELGTFRIASKRPPEPILQISVRPSSKGIWIIADDLNNSPLSKTVSP